MEHPNLRLLAFALAALLLPAGVVATAVGLRNQRRATPESAVRAGPGSSAAVSIDLGRVVCGDCCVGKVWGALGALPGVRDIDVRAGQNTLTVYYDERTNPEQVVESLVAAGESTASLGKRMNPGQPSSEKRWVRTAP